MGIIIFNGQSSESVGIRVSRPPDYNIPERDYEVIQVPGRNGDIIINKGTYKNVTREYEISVPATEWLFDRVMDNVSAWLHSSNGYAVLEDSYDPAHYRMAFYKEATTIENIFNEAGRGIIPFECKPQRYYKVGDTPITCSQNQNIFNYTRFVALPIIIATINQNAAGIINIGDHRIEINAQSEQESMDITINSDIQDIYSGAANLNSQVSMSDNEFPRLEVGNNIVTYSGGITRLKIIPRWWTI